MNITNILLSFILPLLINMILTPLIISYAHKKELFDATDHRKTHVGNIPRLGGIGIFTALILSALTIFILTKELASLHFFVAITIIFASGIVDDIKPVRAKVKLLAQIAAALVLTMGDYTLSHVYIPFTEITLSLSLLKYPVTLIWIIGFTNAINLLDGMDGQAGGVSAIASLTLGIVSVVLGYNNIAITCFILTGALTAFLTFNLPPAKIFMGDSGSLTLGFFLSAIPLLFKTPETKGKVILVAVAVLLIPMLDVFAAMIRRKRKNISFFDPDRGHIHHKFIDFTSLNTKQILIVIYSFCILSGTLATLFIIETNTLTNTGLILNLIIHSILFNFLHQRKEKGIKK